MRIIYYTGFKEGWISIEKIKSMVISRKTIRCKLTMHDHPIQQDVLSVEITIQRYLVREACTQANNLEE